jgi:hypothetical protein
LRHVPTDRSSRSSPQSRVSPDELAYTELLARDDGYDVKRALQNVDGFLKDQSLFGLFGCMGTPIIEGMLPLIRNTDVPCFSPLTGASSARPADMRNVLNLRASYPEVHRLDIGGFDLNFQQPGRNASRFVELTMIGRGGKFIR